VLSPEVQAESKVRMTEKVLSKPESASTAHPTLTLEDISVRFGGITALDSVSLSVARGEICGLMGPNGAGKTTLFDVISGVREPDQGHVWMAEADISSLGPAERSRRGLHRTFQRVQTFGWLSVEDNVLVATEWRGGGGGLFADFVTLPSRRRRERHRRELVEATLDRCGLMSVRAEFAGSLPIGIARMVEFARATIEPPRLLLLDEPASGLDDQEISRLGELISGLRADTDCSVLLVEHNAGFVMEQSDRVVVLALGEVLAEGTPSEIQTNAAVGAAYLGAPQRNT
jgi:branched-chain amino acid transport system ATP-binding protein